MSMLSRVSSIYFSDQLSHVEMAPEDPVEVDVHALNNQMGFLWNTLDSLSVVHSRSVVAYQRTTGNLIGVFEPVRKVEEQRIEYLPKEEIAPTRWIDVLSAYLFVWVPPPLPYIEVGHPTNRLHEAIMDINCLFQRILKRFEMLTQHPIDERMRHCWRRLKEIGMLLPRAQQGLNHLPRALGGRRNDVVRASLAEFHRQCQKTEQILAARPASLILEGEAAEGWGPEIVGSSSRGLLSLNKQLRRAVDMGCEKHIVQCILAGANVNQINSTGDGLLHRAILYQRFNSCKVLLETVGKNGQKIDVNRCNLLGQSPASYAVGEGNFDIFQLLIQHGADMYHIDCDGSSPFGLFKIFHNREFRCLGTSFKIDREKKEYMAEFTSRNYLSQAMQILGFSPLIRENASRCEVEWSLNTGFYESYFWWKFAKYFNEFKSLYGREIDRNTGKEVQAALTGAALAKHITTSEKWERWRAGKPLILNSGIESHCASMLLWDDRLIICNQTGSFQGPVYQAFQFDRLRLTTDVIKKIEDVGSRENLDHFVTFCSVTLVECLALQKGEVEEAIEKMRLAGKLGRNCAWTNVESVIFPLLVLSACRKELGGLSSLNLNLALSHIPKQQDLYEKWRSFQQLKGVEKYLRRCSAVDRIFKPDLELLARAIVVGSKKPFLTDDPRLVERWKQARSAFLSLPELSAKTRWWFQASLAHDQPVARLHLRSKNNLREKFANGIVKGKIQDIIDPLVEDVPLQQPVEVVQDGEKIIGNNYLHLAVYAKQVKSCAFFLSLEEGPNGERIDFDQPNSAGLTPSQLAQQSESVELQTLFSNDDTSRYFDAL